jgi:tetratricopeptide (TPR) repeat protein
MNRFVSSPFRSCARLLALGGASAALFLTGCGQSAEDHLASARESQEQAAYEESIPDLRAVLAEDPNHPEANYLLGIALLRTGQGSPAIWPLRKAAESDAYAVEAGVLLAQTLAGTNNPEEAITAIEKVIARDPELVDGWRTKLQAEGLANRWEDAEASANRLLELVPEDAQGYLLRAATQLEIPRNRESEQSFAKAREAATAAGNLALAGDACVSQARVRLERLEDRKGAEALFEECLEATPTEPNVVQIIGQHYAGKGDLARAEKIFRTAVERAPESLAFRVNLARFLASRGAAPEAEKVLTEATQDFGGAEAWVALSDFYATQGDLVKAEETLAKGSAEYEATDALRAKHAELLIALGRVDEADKLADQMRDDVYATALRGAVLLGRGDAAGALEKFDASLVRWPNNAGVRLQAGRAAEQLGQYERALEEYRQAIRSDMKATDAALAAAYLAYTTGRFNDALEYAGFQTRGRPYRTPDPYLIAARAAVATGRYDRAVEWLDSLAQQAGGEPTAVAELANIEAVRAGPAKGLGIVRESGLDPSKEENLPVLRALVDVELRAKHGDAAIAAIAKALRARPDAKELLDLRGRALVALGRAAEAKPAFEQALAIDGEYARALHGMGEVQFAAGDTAGAIEWFDRAAKADLGDGESAYRAAQVKLASGDKADAERRLADLVRRIPAHAGACNDLAWLLAADGRDLDRALELAERARRLAPQPAIADTLASVQIARGDLDGALGTLRGELERQPEDATLRFRMGEALAKKGETEGAREAYKRALETGPFPEAEQARAALAKLGDVGAKQ